MAGKKQQRNVQDSFTFGTAVSAALTFTIERARDLALGYLLGSWIAGKMLSVETDPDRKTAVSWTVTFVFTFIVYLIQVFHHGPREGAVLVSWETLRKTKALLKDEAFEG